MVRHAIISLPIEWVLEDRATSTTGSPQERVLGWFAPRVPTRVVEGNPGPRRRVYVFEDLRRGP